MKYLIFNPFGIGDVLFSTPMIAAIKAHDSEAHIGYLCNRRALQVLETNPDIDELFVFEKDEFRAAFRRSVFDGVAKVAHLLKSIRRHRFEMVFDLALSRQYNFFLFLLGIRTRSGLDYRKRGQFLTHRVPIEGYDNQSIAEYYLDTLRAVGIQAHKQSTHLTLTASDKQVVQTFFKESGVLAENTIAIVPGGGVSFGKDKINFRRWDIEQYVALAERLIQEENSSILVVCAPDEQDLVQAFEALNNDKIIIAPQTTVRESAAFMKACRLVVANDGGPMHLATAVDAAVVAIFGPTDEQVYGPYTTSSRVKCVTHDIACRPCYKRFRLADCDHRNCLGHLPLEKVYQSVRDVLSQPCGVN